MDMQWLPRSSHVHRFWERTARSVIFGLGVLLLSFPTFSQSSTGRILGDVRDPSDALIVGAAVHSAHSRTIFSHGQFSPIQCGLTSPGSRGSAMGVGCDNPPESGMNFVQPPALGLDLFGAVCDVSAIGKPRLHCRRPVREHCRRFSFQGLAGSPADATLCAAIVT